MTGAARRDDGQTLVLALAMLLFASGIVVGLLAFAFASIKTTDVVRANRNTSYDADAYMEQAIAAIRANSHLGIVNACLSHQDFLATQIKSGVSTFLDPNASPAEIGNIVSDSAAGIPAGTTVTGVLGSTVTMSKPATATTSNDVVTYTFPTSYKQNGTQTLSIFCSATQQPFFQRRVLLEVCPTNTVPCDTGPNVPLVRADVSFFDNQPAGDAGPFGRAVQINSWSTR